MRHVDISLLLILLLGLAFRLQYVEAPIADAHRWRQTDNAAVARHFYEDSFNILYPQVDWGGRQGYVEMEFPLYPALVASTYKIFGEREILGRLVAILFSVSTIAAVYFIGRRTYNSATGRAAAFLVAISPVSVFFGRAFIGDTLMLFFTVAAMLGVVTYFQTDRKLALTAGGLALALAFLVKLSALVVVAPFAFAGWQARRLTIYKDRRFLVTIGMALAATAAWYWHAHAIYRQTGLTVGIWSPAGVYPPELAVVAGPTKTFSGFSTPSLLADSGFYRELITRLRDLYVTPPGVVLCIIGTAMSWRKPGTRLVLLWVAATVVFILAVGVGNLGHQYYQLPILPPLALLFGVAAAPAFDGGFVRKYLGGRVLGPLVAGAGLLAIAVFLLHSSRVVHDYFRPDWLDLKPIQAAGAVRGVVEPKALLVVVEYDDINNGAVSPYFLYHAHHEGWTFDLKSISPFAVEHLRKLDAAYFVTTIWPTLLETRPEVAAYLETYKRVPVPGAPSDTAMFSLTGRAEASASTR